MQKKYFPIFVDISKKKIVVIGGGVIATRRVHTLLQFAEQITVVAPEITVELQEMSDKGLITWQCEEYFAKQIAEADMVIAATNQPKVNHQIKADCIQREQQTGHQIWVSVIDDKEMCDFYFPSIVQREDVIVGISSGGTSPSKTKTIRKKIETLLESDSIYDK